MLVRTQPPLLYSRELDCIEASLPHVSSKGTAYADTTIMLILLLALRSVPQ